MKKSKTVQLVLITAALASCNKAQKDNEWSGGNKTYVRGDSTAYYTRTHHHGVGNALLWYYAFRPYGNYNSQTGAYQKAGYYSRGISESSNIGTNGFKGSISRGGFGRGGYSVSS
jgi:hypothetical protein